MTSLGMEDEGGGNAPPVFLTPPKTPTHSEGTSPFVLPNRGSKKRQLKLTDFGSVEYSPNFGKIANGHLHEVPNLDLDTPPRDVSGSRIAVGAKPGAKTSVNDRSGKDHKKRYYQPVIDANQREIGARVCRKCGFVGDLDDDNDRRLHKRVHSRFEQGRTDGDEVLSYKGLKYELVLHATASHKVIAVQHDSAPALRKKALGALKFIELQVGSIHNAHLGGPEDVVLLSVDVQKKMVDGCVCSEAISGNSLIWLELQLNSVLQDLSTKADAKCGIYFAWVAPSARRKGRATSLLDTLRLHYPRLFPSKPGGLLRTQLAFSEPTDDGLSFFQSYLKTQDCRLYRSSRALLSN